MSAPRPSIASFWHDLPREGKQMLSIVAFQFIGTGLVLPFWVVYLHEMRGYSLGVVGLLVASMSAAGVIVIGPGGVLIDRIGPRRTMIGVLAVTSLGQVVVALGDRLAWSACGIALVGIGFSLSWPASQSLVATIVPARIRPRYFGMNFSLLNLGIGIGGIVGGFVVDVDRLSTFQGVYLADAASYLPAMFLLAVPLRHVGGPVRAPSEDQAAPAVSYLTVLRHPGMATLCTLIFVSALVGYSQLNAGMPAFAREVGEISTRALGFAFAANTLVIVLLQLVVLQRIEGRRRTRVIVVMSAIWAACWVALGASGLVPGTTSATLLVVTCTMLFAVGETLLQPTIPAIVNDLAPDHLRGRYNALTSGMFQAAAIVGPITAGFMIDHDLAPEFIGLLVAGCLVVAWLAVTRLEAELDPQSNGVLASPDPEVMPET